MGSFVFDCEHSEPNETKSLCPHEETSGEDWKWWVRWKAEGLAFEIHPLRCSPLHSASPL